MLFVTNVEFNFLSKIIPFSFINSVWSYCSRELKACWNVPSVSLLGSKTWTMGMSRCYSLMKCLLILFNIIFLVKTAIISSLKNTLFTQGCYGVDLCAISGRLSFVWSRISKWAKGSLPPRLIGSELRSLKLQCVGGDQRHRDANACHGRACRRGYGYHDGKARCGYKKVRL